MSKRVIIAQFLHETNSFSSLKVTLEDYRHRDLLYGEDIVPRYENTESSLGGFIQVARRAGWKLVPTVSARSSPAGNVTAECYATLKKAILDRVRSALVDGPVDGVLLALHGAMVADGIDDPDGDLLVAVRSVVGPGVPLLCCLDMHANISDAMAAAADGLFVYKTYPHVDRAENAARAARVLERAMRGETTPVLGICRPPFLPPLLGQFTGAEPMAGLMGLVRSVEQLPGVLNASVACGFPYTDVYEAGFCAAVVTDGDRGLARTHASTIAAEAWARREAFDVAAPSVDQALAEAARASETPVVLADAGDNTGAGAPGNDSSILQRVLGAGLAPAVLGVWWDPALVRQAVAAGPGAIIPLSLTASRNGARPMEAVAGVRTLSAGSFIHKGPNGRGMLNRMGPAAVLTFLAPGRTGPTAGGPASPDRPGAWATGRPGVEVLVSGLRIQPVDAEVFRSVGIEPLDYRAVILKSSVHFRADFTPLARGGVLTMDSEGVSSPDPRRFEFKKLRRPIYPLDPVAWEPGRRGDDELPAQSGGG